MLNRILIIDVSNLAYRNFHAMGGALSHNDQPTDVLFGLFRDVEWLTDRFSPSCMVWCFDGGYDERRKIYPEYKSGRKKRKDMDEDEKRAYRSLRKQVYQLRSMLLDEVGYRNVLWQEGYEADDLIASVCDNLKGNEEAIIVSTDSDLFQLLSGKVSIWNPIKKKAMTADHFVGKWGIHAYMWADVKAIAGCDTDDVPGVPRVGEKTAVKFLSGNLKETTKAYKTIVDNNALWRRNLELVRLPMKGTKRFELKKDEVTRDRWNRVMGNLGMKSLERRRK